MRSVSRAAIFWFRIVLLLGIVWLLAGGFASSSSQPANLETSWIARSQAAAIIDSAAKSVASGLLYPPETRAQLGPSSWSSSQNVSHTSGESRMPALAVDHTGVIHIVWEEGSYIYHTYFANNAWSIPWRAATGEQPTIAIDHNNVPHLIFVNEFRGNYEIYYCQWTGTSWTLPRNVSSTSGVSAIPDIAIDTHNTVHVVWTDNSPGYNVIYYGRWTGTFWINRPIPHARGSVPAIAIGGDDVLHVVWQDRDTLADSYEIYHTQWDGEAWSLPENISDSSDHSTIPDVAVSWNGRVHLTWEERVAGKDQIYYCGGESLFWSRQENISQSSEDSYLPNIVLDCDGFPHVAWDEADHLAHSWRMTPAVPWVEKEHIAQNAEGIADVVLAAEDNGRLHAAWAERLPGGDWEIFYSHRAPFVPYRAWLPLVMSDHSP